MNITPILAAASGKDLMHEVFVIFIVIAVGLVIWLLGRWGFPKLKAPEIVMTIWDGLFVLIGALLVINFLLSLIGHPLIDF